MSYKRRSTMMSDPAAAKGYMKLTSIDSTELVPKAGLTVPTKRDMMISSSVRLVR